MQESISVPRREPALNVPAPLLAWIGLMVAIHLGREFLSGEADISLLLETAFVPSTWSVATGWTTPEGLIAAVGSLAKGEAGAINVALARFFANEPVRPWTAVSYSLLHGSWAHLGLNCVWFVAFGVAVVRRAGPFRSLILWIAAALGGAIAQWMSNPYGVQFLIGASASVSGFMAAAATFMFQRPGAPRWSFLAERPALVFIGIWFATNLVFPFIAQPLGLVDGEIAWQAHIGGLVAGLLVFPLLDPFVSRPETPEAS